MMLKVHSNLEVVLFIFLFLKTLSLFAFKLNCSLLKYFKSENKM
jgi:hypothetical protein